MIKGEVMAEEKKSEEKESEPAKDTKTTAVPLGAENTMLNGQITDAVTQVGVNVLGQASAIAMGSLYQSTAQALANAAHNATMAQQQMNIIAQAATTQGVNIIYGINSANSSRIDITSTDIAELKVLIESAHKVIKKAKSKKKKASKP
jgi:Killing trait